MYRSWGAYTAGENVHRATGCMRISRALLQRTLMPSSVTGATHKFLIEMAALSYRFMLTRILPYAPSLFDTMGIPPMDVTDLIRNLFS